MTFPSWISENLALAAYSAYTATPNSTTIVLTTSAITFCQADGSVYTCSPNDILPLLLSTSSLVPTPQSTVSEAPVPVPDVLPLVSEPASLSTLSNSATESSTSATLDFVDILSDLLDASQAEVIPLHLTATTPATQVVQLLERLSRNGRRGPCDQHLQLHLAYKLGILQHEYPVQFRNQLEHSIAMIAHDEE